MAENRFYVPTRVVTGRGCFEQLGKLVRPLARRALLVGSPGRRPLLQEAAGLLAAAGVETAVYGGVVGEPTVAMVEAARAQAREMAAETVIGIGGGSALDAAKAAAGLFGLPGAVAEYHAGRPLDPGSRLPMVAVPTTAGTGAEVTRNAVLIDPDRRVKQSIRDDSWFPTLALVDPALTVTLPPTATASTGADALCQALEAYVSAGAGPLSDPLAAEAATRIGRSLERAVRQGDDLAAREDMLYGSLLAGMAMVNAGLGAVHGLAHPLGARYGIPHGVVCGLLLPHVMAYNLAYAPKYAQVAALLGLDVHGVAQAAAGEMAVACVADLMARTAIPAHLSTLGVRAADIPAITAEALKQSSTRYNPRPMGAEDVRAVLERAL